MVNGLAKIIKDYEDDGFIVIKLSEDEVLDGDRLRIYNHTVFNYPDKELFYACLATEYAKQIAKERKGKKVNAAKEVESFAKDKKFPDDLHLTYSQLPLIRGNVPYYAFISMISEYKIGLEERMSMQGFSEMYRNNLGLIADEVLMNAFKHGNNGGIRKEIEVNEIYMRGLSRHGYVIIVRDSGAKMLTKEIIEEHKTAIDSSTGKPKMTTSKRGFVLIDALSDRSWVLPGLGNNVGVHLFEPMPEHIMGNHYVQRKRSKIYVPEHLESQ
jgi:anti-sigma regulatory factor (Ser/Thr protein kinase)